MFHTKHDKFHKTTVWIVGLVLIVLVTITLVLQTQIFTMLKDMQTSIFSTKYIKQVNQVTELEKVGDGLPLPPTKEAGIVTELEKVGDGLPLPPTKTLTR